MLFFDPLYFLIIGPGLILSLWAHWKVKGTFKKYAQIPGHTGKTGADVAREILDRKGIHDVKVEEVSGFLSDHYDPKRKVLRLSPDIYRSSSIAAVGVAAHEAGHAVQHAERYRPLVLRTAIAPVAAVSSNLSIVLIIAGMLLSSLGMVKIGVFVFAIAVFFTLVTLPVEFNASSRAKNLIAQYGVVTKGEHIMVGKVLSAAAMTYVAAAVVAILQLLYFLLRSGLLGSRD
jgi:uncharacterized protein